MRLRFREPFLGDIKRKGLNIRERNYVRKVRKTKRIRESKEKKKG